MKDTLFAKGPQAGRDDLYLLTDTYYKLYIILINYLHKKN